MVRVLHVVPNMQMGGLETFIMNIFRHIDREKVQFDFLVHYKQKFQYDEEIERMGGRIYRMSVREDNNIIKYIYELYKFFKQHDEYKIIHGHMESLGFIYMGMAKKFNIPCRVAHAHNSACEKTFKGYVKSLLKKGFSIFATDLFACSQLAGQYMFGDTANYTVVNNAIEIKDFSYSEDVRHAVRKELGVTEDTFVIGHIGRFEQQKNHEFLLDVFQEVNRRVKSKLFLIGCGSLEKKIRKKVADDGMNGDVFFLGTRKDCARIYQAMDAFVMPSFFEGLPVTGVEAQVSGLPCFFSDSISLELKMGKSSYFLSIKDSAKKWADCIENVLLNKEDRNLLSRHARDVRFDIEKQSEILERFYLRWA